MLGVSRHTDYAARIVLHLTALGPGAQVPIREVAEQKKLPVPFVRRIVAQLVQSRILTTVRGNRGGIQLGRPAAEISLLDLVEAMEGPVEMSPCVGEDATCPFRGRCPVQVAWRQVGSDLSRSLGSISFDSLAHGTRGHEAAHQKLDGTVRASSLSRRRP